MKKLIILSIVGFTLTASVTACSTSKRSKCDAYSQNTSKVTTVNTAK
ncbi:MAG: hypothetical protein KA521_01730 [Crocinitomicaceae bacterium]|nr:hypothetical protein [Crocinitomicaceae bacterium]